MKEILRTRNLSHAHLLRAALEAAGIDALVDGDHAGAIFDGGVSVVVLHDTDAARALDIIADFEGEE